MRRGELFGLVLLAGDPVEAEGIAGVMGAFPLPCQLQTVPTHLVAGEKSVRPKGWAVWIGEGDGVKHVSCTRVGVFGNVLEEAEHLAVVGEPAAFFGIAASVRRRALFGEGYEDRFLSFRLYGLNGNVVRRGKVYGVWGLSGQVEVGGARGRCAGRFCGEVLFRIGLNLLYPYVYAAGGLQVYGMLGTVLVGGQVVVNGASFQLGFPPSGNFPHILLTPWLFQGFVGLAISES